MAERVRLLPLGGRVGDAARKQLAAELRGVVSFIQSRVKQAWTGAPSPSGKIGWDPEAEKFWVAQYPNLSRDFPGLVGAMTARAEAQVFRMSCLYAALDCSMAIKKDHLKAAMAAWKYSEDSCRYLFGDSLGNSIADAILAMLRMKHPNAVSRTATNKFLGGKIPKNLIDRALQVLLMQDLAEVMVASNNTGPGPKPQWWSAVMPNP